MAGHEETRRVPTWRDGVILSLEARAQLTPEQLQQFGEESEVRDLREIDQMPEPMRTWAQKAVDDARTRIADRERRAAS